MIIKIKLNYNIIDINTEFVHKHKKSFHHFRCRVVGGAMVTKKRMGGASEL